MAALAVVATSFSTVAVSQPATAQIANLDPDLCASTYRPIPVSQAGAAAETACRSLVAWRNTVVNHPDSDIGSDHPMLRWGTAAQPTLNTWKGVWVSLVSGEHVVTALNIGQWKIAGPHPGPLPGIREISLNHNLLSGGLPTWIYNATDLEFYSLLGNYFSGPVVGSAFRTPNLVNLHLMRNRFTGPIPNFNFTRLSKLTDIVLSSNNFSGEFPDGWSVLADGRGIQHLQLGRIGARGNLPSWVSTLKFADTWLPAIRGSGGNHHLLDLSGNQLCIPANFQTPAYTKVSGARASVGLTIQDNQCPRGQPESYSSFYTTPRNLNIQWETVDDAGNPTTENPTGLKVTWKRPDNITGPVRYLVRGHLLIPAEEAFFPNTRTYRYCPSYALSGYTTSTTAENLSVTLTRSNCRSVSSVTTETQFDPAKYVASVSLVRISGSGTIIYSSYGQTNDWTVYIATDGSKTYRDAGLVLGMNYWYNAYRWDVASQAWIRDLYRMNRPTPNLEPGSIITVNQRVPAAWLTRAGLSTADADTPVELQNGWNIISAGDFASRGDNEDGAFFISDELIDCSSSQGVIAVMRHNARSDSFNIELPCHPDRETALTRGQAFLPLNEIEELDTLFVYFRSALPVTVNWDTDNNRYAPAS